MRAVLAFLLLGTLAAPSFAGHRSYRSRGCGLPARHYGHRHHRYSYRGYGHRRYSYYRSHRYRHYARTYSYGSCYDFCGYRDHGYRYSHGYRSYVALAPIYSRYGTVLTLDDEVFRGAADTSDADGLPQLRTEPVGSRFLADTK